MQAVWQTDPEWWSANRGEKADCGPYELVAFDIPASDGHARLIGWEVYSGPKLQSLVTKGDALTFDGARSAAEDVWRRLQSPLPLPLEWESSILSGPHQAGWSGEHAFYDFDDRDFCLQTTHIPAVEDQEDPDENSPEQFQWELWENNAEGDDPDKVILHGDAHSVADAKAMAQAAMALIITPPAATSSQ